MTSGTIVPVVVGQDIIVPVKRTIGPVVVLELFKVFQVFGGLIVCSEKLVVVALNPNGLNSHTLPLLVQQCLVYIVCRHPLIGLNVFPKLVLLDSLVSLIHVVLVQDLSLTRMVGGKVVNVLVCIV